MLESLTDLVSGSAWTYVVVLVVAALDAVFPLVPSETVLVAAAALAATGRLELGPVLAAGAAGALLGDNAAYLAGRLLGPRVTARLLASPKHARLVTSAERQLARRGATLIVVSRFVPGGRTATMLAAGLLALRWSRFLAYDAIAAVLWALYGGVLGFAGGTRFADEPLKAVGLALALAFAAAVIAELSRRLSARRRRRRVAEGFDG